MKAFTNFAPRTLEFDRLNAISMAYSAEAAYKSEGEIKEFADENGFPVVSFFDALGTQAFLMGRDDSIILSFRGTEPDSLEDIATDLRIRQVGGPLGGQVHRGFLMATLAVWDDYDLPNGRKHKGVEHTIKEMRKTLSTTARDEGRPEPSPALWITGHSLGGALATIAAALLAERGKPVQGVYTFGSPRVGDSAFASLLESRLSRIYRIVNNNDIVTRVPPRSFGYDHVGEFWYLPENPSSFRNDPNSWYLFLDRALGRLADIGEIGTDGVKDHAINNKESGDGYIPAILSAI